MAVTAITGYSCRLVTVGNQNCGNTNTQPPPEIIEGEDEHYEVETILNARPTPNRRGIQYLVKWKGYPDSENTWIPASGMKHAMDLVHEYHRRHPRAQTSARTRR
jgi:hypothetical protein